MTCRIPGSDSAVLEPALTRAGISIAGAGPADVEIRSAAGGYVGFADGRRTDLPDLAAVSRWAWMLPTGPRVIRRADPADVAAAVASVSSIGPYVTVDDDRDGELLRLFYDDPGAMAEAVRRVGARFAMTEARVAASTLQFVVAAGLWSVALGALAASGVVPDLDRLRYRIGEDFSVRLSLPEPGGWITTGDPAPLLLRAVVEGHLKPFHTGLRAVTKVAAGLLWGNAAAALRSALRPLPADLGDLGDLGDRLLTAPSLRGALSPDGTRRSCCLFYRTPTGHTCRACPLVGAIVTQRGEDHA
ncbi:iron complex transport system ATP-binding protein [Saccharothrix tamanrassetensis]|uniref:Iron complex transport system ATP-binding protein n=1 Tax=Saccharothrix tamanrassetensis TaxID=1051531 RepID=A0A841CK57_9PSEU|nr:(2Fe-2S)-binding protein [Saccharothrix tamanrassetensis]MBB5957343.1 iron complex transport system ATP-binding protein [Saccharothrix tamanrassetensis]